MKLLFFIFLCQKWRKVNSIYYQQKIKEDGQKGGGKVDLNNLEGVSSMINNLMGGSGIEGLGNIGKVVGLLGKDRKSVV